MLNGILAIIGWFNSFLVMFTSLEIPFTNNTTIKLITIFFYMNLIYWSYAFIHKILTKKGNANGKD